MLTNSHLIIYGYLNTKPPSHTHPETRKQPIRTRYLSHVTGYQPIRARYLGHVTSYQPIRDQFIPELSIFRSKSGDHTLDHLHPEISAVRPETRVCFASILIYLEVLGPLFGFEVRVRYRVLLGL
eukprot:sb/3475697/